MAAILEEFRFISERIRAGASAEVHKLDPRITRQELRKNFHPAIVSIWIFSEARTLHQHQPRAVPGAIVCQPLKAFNFQGPKFGWRWNALCPRSLGRGLLPLPIRWGEGRG